MNASRRVNSRSEEEKAAAAIVDGATALLTQGRRAHTQAVFSEAYRRLMASVNGTLTRETAEKLLIEAQKKLVLSGRVAIPPSEWEDWVVMDSERSARHREIENLQKWRQDATIRVVALAILLGIGLTGFVLLRESIVLVMMWAGFCTIAIPPVFAFVFESSKLRGADLTRIYKAGIDGIRALIRVIMNKTSKR